MATYRLKSKLFGDLDKGERKENKGLSAGQVLLGGAALLGGYKLAGAGKLGVGAQNAVNSFRMKTSKIGSQRYQKASTALSTNRQNEINQFKNYASYTGANVKEGTKAINEKYGNLMFGGSAKYAPVPAPQNP